jgi:2-methylisocitrate lyase-like PEP mutase family enzyme
MNKLYKFKKLHEQNELLFLPNAWDVLSAIIIEQAGFKAIGTTSWGVANAMGHQDGERIQFYELLKLSKKIISAVKVPVTVDIESGYSEDIDIISDNVLKIADVGAVGINIEDSFKNKQGLKNTKNQCELIEKIRNKLDQNGYNEFFINARVDTYLQKHSLEETVDRSIHYISSGADGIFVPGLCQKDEIKRLVKSIEAPLNTMSLPHLTDINHLNDLGVKRFSMGNAFSDAAISFIEETAGRLLTKKNTENLYSDREIRTVFQ